MQIDATDQITGVLGPAGGRVIQGAAGQAATGGKSFLEGRGRSALNIIERGVSQAAAVVSSFGSWADGATADETQLEEAGIFRSLGQAISKLRWMSLVILVVITLVQPRLGRLGLTNWEMLVFFGVYNAVAELTLGRSSDRRALSWRVVLDLPAACAVYYASSRPGNPQTDLIFIAVICAALTLPLRWSLAYTAAAIILIALIEPTLPLWSQDTDAVRELGGRMVLLAFAGTGTAIMYRRLLIERAKAKSAHNKAEHLEEMDRMREEFISSITHDLRTPFTAVRAGLGMVEMSVSDRLRPEELHLLNSVRRNGDRLGILINDLLAFTQFEAGALELDTQPLDVCDVIAGAITTVQPLTLEKKQMLEACLPEPLPHRGDKRKLEQVITNLLDNAHRHTPCGTRITITGMATADEVIVEIRDDGPGIPPQERELIFQSFHKADVSEGGWGLGLTIAQAITAKHGGRLWVESEPGQGCAFFVALPRMEGTPTSPLDGQAVEP